MDTDLRSVSLFVIRMKQEFDEQIAELRSQLQKERTARMELERMLQDRRVTQTKPSSGLSSLIQSVSKIPQPPRVPSPTTTITATATTTKTSGLILTPRTSLTQSLNPKPTTGLLMSASKPTLLGNSSPLTKTTTLSNSSPLTKTPSLFNSSHLSKSPSLLKTSTLTMSRPSNITAPTKGLLCAPSTTPPTSPPFASQPYTFSPPATLSPPLAYSSAEAAHVASLTYYNR